MSLDRLLIYAVVTIVVMAGFAAVALFSWWYADRWAKDERHAKPGASGTPDRDERTFVVRSDPPPDPRA